jgi:autotransporter translocation and assembly factor TamB
MKKFFIIISILGFVLLAAAELYIQSDSFALRIRPLVVDRLKAVLGNDVEIGWVRANLIPLYLEARDISLSDDRGKPAAAIRKIKVYINPLPLVFKKIRLSSIVVLEPRIAVERSKDGTFNLSPLIERIKANISRMQAEGPSGYRLILHTIAVNEGRISFDDGLTSTHLDVSQLHVSAAVNLAGDSVKIVLKNSTIHVVAPAYPESSGSLRASLWYDHGRFRLDSSELTTADTTISLTGDMGSLPDMPLNLRFKIRSGPQTLRRFSSFLRPVKKEQGPHIEASAVIRGNFVNPSVEGTLKFTGISYQGLQLQDAALSFGYGNKSLTLAGEKWKLARGNKSILVESINLALGYSDHGLDIKRFDVLAGDLSIRIAGRADPQRGFDAVLTAESHNRGRTLSFLTAIPLEGRVDVKGYITGAFNAPLFDGALSAGPLTIRGIVFDTVDGRLQYRDKKISVVSADIHQQASRYFFDGAVDFAGKEPLFSARARIIRSDVVSIVALFYEPLPLHLSATGELSFTGTSRDFAGSARLALEPGSAYGESFTKGTITAVLTKDKIAFPQVLLNKGSGAVKGTGWIGFDGTYSADIESRGVKLADVDHLAGVPVDGRFDLEIEASGSFPHPKVSASVEMEDLYYNQSSLGGLTAELQIDGGVLLCRSQFADDRAGLTARLALSRPFGWSVQATVNSDALDPFLVIGKKDLLGSVRMIAEGNLSARGNGADFTTLSGTASFRRLGLVVGDYRIDNDGEAAVTVQAGRLNVTALNFKGPGTKIAVTGGARLLKDMDFSFTGAAHLSLLRILYREIEHGDGTAEVKLTVKDEWKNPDVAGELLVKNGEIKIKDIPQKFSALTGKITFDRSRIVVDSLAGEVGGGTLSSSGWVQLAGLALRDFSLKASFDNVTVRYPEGLTSTLSGDLYYDGDASEQSLTGEVAIKRARYEKRVEWKSMLVDIGKGLYQKKKTEVAWIGDTQINIRFHGKDSILLQNNLAKIPLDVDMFLRGTVNQPQLLGRVEARKGLVYFRKNEFKILHASADFVDPNRMNPVLDIQAEIQVRDYRIRLAVSGTADRAVVTLLSDPSLPDSDILTLLALGKTGTELKGKESGVGMSEAASFATGQFQDMFESRARSLTGLDRFQVDPYVSKSDTSVPRVTVGKELVQDKLYVTYSSNVGSTTPEQIFRIEYVLNKHFSLVGERNELGNTGADIKYRFEFK